MKFQYLNPVEGFKLWTFHRKIISNFTERKRGQIIVNSCHSEAEASRPNLKMDTINLKLQLVEGIEKQLVLGEELIAHHLQTRKSKPALISPSILKRIQRKQCTFWRPYQVHGSFVLNCTRFESVWELNSLVLFALSYQSQSHSELEEQDPISSNSKLDTTRPLSISRYNIIVTSVILSWQCQ